LETKNWDSFYNYKKENGKNYYNFCADAYKSEKLNFLLVFFEGSRNVHDKCKRSFPCSKHKTKIQDKRRWSVNFNFFDVFSYVPYNIYESTNCSFTDLLSVPLCKQLPEFIIYGECPITKNETNTETIESSTSNVLIKIKGEFDDMD
jgi:hypothetical protein